MPSPGQGGMGNPHEERWYFENVRDFGQGDPRERAVIVNPTKDGCQQDVPPGVEAAIDRMLCKFEDKLKRFVFISKRPAFVEPPFFSKPLIATNRVTLLAGATGDLALYVIGDRQRIVVTKFGVDTDNPTAYAAGSFRFSFVVSSVDAPTAGRAILIPLFNDQTVGGLPSETTILPGTTTFPHNLLDEGLAFQVKGPTAFRFRVVNGAAVDVIFRSLVGFYQYWLPHADAYASADLQL